MISNYSLELFKKTAVGIEAYSDFLKVRKIDYKQIKSKDDFKNLPITSKVNYLKQYPLDCLMFNDNSISQIEFCSTSGSTGEPFYFPRDEALADQYSRLIDDYLLQVDPNKERNTLVLIGFGMGVWIGGVFTLRAFEISSKRLGYPLSILPIGYNKVEMFKALRRLAPHYDQTIIIGYPPFVKQIIDEAADENINMSRLKPRFLFAAESFTEDFRDYICKRTRSNPILDTLNIYGTADIGAMAHETPISILIRRLASKDELLFNDIFGQSEKTPTLAQYNPKFIEFEEVDDEIILTGKSILPLIRYAIGDHGGVYSFAEMKKKLDNNGYNIIHEMQKSGIPSTERRRPFVYVYERINFSVTLHGINIYPEFAKKGLLHPDLVAIVTGRFTMITKYDKNHDQYIEFNIELAKGVKTPSKKFKALITNIIIDSLKLKSSEFSEISKTINPEQLISIIFWPLDHSKYFPAGIKQKWAHKE